MTLLIMGHSVTRYCLDFLPAVSLKGIIKCTPSCKHCIILDWGIHKSFVIWISSPISDMWNRFSYSQRRRGEFEPGKAQYSTSIFLTGCFLQERIETQNLGKAQALMALPAVAALNSCTLLLFNVKLSSDMFMNTPWSTKRKSYFFMCWLATQNVLKKCT